MNAGFRERPVRSGKGFVEIRYLGFDQRQNARAYRFEISEKGQPSIQRTVTANMDIFRLHRVGIQEGPSLSESKLTADLEKGFEGEHELTAEDMSAHVNHKSLEEAQRAAMRKPPRRRPAPPKAIGRSPWRNTGI